MENEGGSIFLDTLNEDGDDEFEMMDVEEGELVGLETDLHNDSVKNADGDGVLVNGDHNCKRQKKKKKKKKKEERKSRFVLNACKRLKERKTHMLYTAVGRLGVSALSDLIKEKQFSQQNKGQELAQNKEIYLERVQPEPAIEGVSDCRPHLDHPLNQSNIEEKRTSVRDRIRVPVAYDDIIQDEGRETQST